jgi:hypothetical protein
MGSTTFYHKRTAPNMKEAYNQLVEDAIDEYGNDAYNGTISTTNGFVDVTKKFKESGKKLSAFIESAEDVMDKRDCWGICVLEPKLNTNKIKSQVELVLQVGRRVWETRYEVQAEGRLIGSHPLQAGAIRIARDYTELTKISSHVTRVNVLKEGEKNVAFVNYKPSSEERQGEYVLFGWAAE